MGTYTSNDRLWEYVSQTKRGTSTEFIIIALIALFFLIFTVGSTLMMVRALESVQSLEKTSAAADDSSQSTLATSGTALGEVRGFSGQTK